MPSCCDSLCSGSWLECSAADCELSDARLTNRNPGETFWLAVQAICLLKCSETIEMYRAECQQPNISSHSRYVLALAVANLKYPPSLEVPMSRPTWIHLATVVIVTDQGPGDSGLQVSHGPSYE